MKHSKKNKTIAITQALILIFGIMAISWAVGGLGI